MKQPFQPLPARRAALRAGSGFGKQAQLFRDKSFVHRLANELARRGHHVTLIHSDACSFLAGREPTGSYDDPPNITVHALRRRFSPSTRRTSQQA